MAENFILILFVLLSVALFVATRFFFRVVLPAITHQRVLSLLCGNALIFLFLLSVALLSGEIYYRFVYDSTDSFGLCRTTQRWFERYYKKNATGFRDSLNYMPTPARGTRRISFVGDSFTAGHGIADVENRFANIVRTNLPDHEIHVLSECGWDTGMEINLLDFIPTSGYETDCIVLVYCLNDVADIVPEWLALSKRLYESPKPGFFFQYSYVLNTIHGRLKAASEPQLADYYQFVQDGYKGELWEQQKTRLTELHNHVKSQEWSLLVVTFPFVHAMQQPYPYQDLHDQLAEFWDQQQVPHLDLLSTFEDLKPQDLVVSRRDAHPNERAHSLAAMAITDFLKQHGP